MHQLDPAGAPMVPHVRSGAHALLEASRSYCSGHSYAHNDVISCPAESIYFVEDGLAIATSELANSKRQVVALYVPGDIINYERLFFSRAFSEVSAVNSLRLAHITATDFKHLLDSSRSYERHFHRYVAYQAMLAQAWIVNVGRRSATERTAHLLCELFCRLSTASSISGDSCTAPLTQNVLADILGLSLVHLNRSLKHIKESGLAVFQGKKLLILDWKGLAELAGFDIAYLTAAHEIGRSMGKVDPTS